jgi:hypothetical protein
MPRSASWIKSALSVLRLNRIVVGGFAPFKRLARDLPAEEAGDHENCGVRGRCVLQSGLALREGGIAVHDHDRET